jgi:hypothetical protein
MPFRGSLDEFQGLLDQVQKAQASGNAPDLTRLRNSAEQLEDASDAIAALNGDFRAIPRPPSKNGTIEQLLTQGKEVSTAFASVAGKIRQLDQIMKRIDWTSQEASIGASSEMMKIATDLLPEVQKMSNEIVPAWNKTMNGLNIGRCMPPTSGYSTPSDTGGTRTDSSQSPHENVPASPPTTPERTPERTFTGAEAELLGEINGQEYEECSPRAEDENSRIIAALNCDTVRQGPERQPLIAKAASSSALSALAHHEAASVLSSSSECSPGESFEGSWHNASKTAGGPMICKNDSGYFRMWWGDERTNIYMIAEAKDAAALYQWWRAGDFLR